MNKSLQMLLESDADWKEVVVQRLTNLETAMSKVAVATSMAEIHDLMNHASTPHPAFAGDIARDVGEAASKQKAQDDRVWEIDIDAVGGPAAIPASHLAERVQSDAEHLTMTKPESIDIVVQGVVTLKRAQDLFDLYHNRFDHFLYRILREDHSFGGIRSASPLLLSAICTVSALQTASPDYEKCYRAFLKACSARAFSKDCAIEDVQAYCIGAFWLSDISWNMVGLGRYYSYYSSETVANLRTSRSCSYSASVTPQHIQSSRGRQRELYENPTILSRLRLRPSFLHSIRSTSDDRIAF